MRNIVACPECHRPAPVLAQFALDSADGPVEYLRIRCDGPLSFLVLADEVRWWSRSAELAVAA